MIRWPGHIEPGTVKTEMFASLDWVPTLVDIAGGPKGDGAEGRDREGRLSRDRQDHARRRRPARLPRRQGASPRATPSSTTRARTRRRSATRTGRCTSRWCLDAPTGFLTGVMPYHWTQVVNIKRDPFETSIGEQAKTLLGMGGALGGPVTAYVYDWNMLPIGQALWLKELSDLHRLPADAGPGELQPRPGHGPGEEDGSRPTSAPTERATRTRQATPPAPPATGLSTRLSREAKNEP